MDYMSRADTFRLNRDRRRNHALCPTLRAHQRDMVNAIEQRNNPPHCIGILESGKCRLELCGLNRDPDHVNRRDFSGDRNTHLEIAVRTFQAKLFGIVLQRLAPDDQGDKSTSMRQTSANQTANAARSKNRMPHRFGHVVRHGVLDSQEVNFVSR